MGYYRDDYFRWPEYVSVAQKKKNAEEKIKSLSKKGKNLNPVNIEGRLIAKTFWGKSWCQNLETYSDYSNRLPRGRSYVRNGSVIDLNISKGSIDAQVMGSSLYEISIKIKPMSKNKWQSLVKSCAGKIDSLIELLKGKFSKSVMAKITEKEGGLFPDPKEIEMDCSCPDGAGMCKHIAAVLYGVGATLDEKPERLFTLRHVDHLDLIESAGKVDELVQPKCDANILADSELSDLFGIELDQKTAAAKIPKKKASKVVVEKKTLAPKRRIMKKK